MRKSLLMKGVGLWVSSQRPKWIPVEVRSETWRWYVFFLDYDEDAKEMVKYTHGRISVDELQEPKQSYSFWEIKRDTRVAQMERECVKAYS